MFLLFYRHRIQDYKVPYSEEHSFPDPDGKAPFHAVFSVPLPWPPSPSLFVKACWPAAESNPELCSGPPLLLVLVLTNTALCHSF